MFGNLICNRGSTVNQWGKDELLNSGARTQVICKEVQLNPCFTPLRNIIRLIKDINVKKFLKTFRKKILAIMRALKNKIQKQKLYKTDKYYYVKIFKNSKQ